LPKNINPFIDTKKSTRCSVYKEKKRNERSQRIYKKKYNKRKKENQVFKRRTDRLLRLIEAGAPAALPPEHQWGLPDKEGFPGEAVEAYHQTPARSTKPSNLAERLHCIRRGVS
jgi:hypothetical protein